MEELMTGISKHRNFPELKVKSLKSFFCLTNQKPKTLTHFLVQIQKKTTKNKTANTWKLAPGTFIFKWTE